MEVRLNRESFYKAMSAAAAVVPGKASRPILRKALCVCKAGDWMEVQATDMEIGLRCRVETTGKDELKPICLPCTMLAGLLKECQTAEVVLSVKGSKALLVSGLDSFEIMVESADGFPEVPAMPGDDAGALEMPAGLLCRMIDQAAFAVAREQGRYATNGLYIGAGGGALDVVGTDGRRLAWAHERLEDCDALFSAIVPRKLYGEIRKACGALKDTILVQLMANERQLIVRAGMVTLSGNLVSGVYPKYRKIVPKAAAQVVTLNREAFMQGLRKAIYLTSEDTLSVTLKLCPAKCVISSCSPDKGQSSIVLGAEYDGPEFAVQFNPVYLLDALSVMTDEDVKLELKDHASAAVLRSGDKFTYVLMPVNKD